MATKLPVRKPGVRRNRITKGLTGGDTPTVSPIQDPGVRSVPGAFGSQEAAALQGAGQDLQALAVEKQDSDDRLKRAQLRIDAKHDINNSLILVDEFEQEEQKIFDELVADNKLGDVDFNQKYANAIDKKFSAILESSVFSSQEGKLTFQSKLLEARFKLGDDRGIKNSTALEQRQMGIARKGLMAFQLDPDRAGEGFSEVISGARAKLNADFAGTLSESNERILINEVVFEQFSPRFTALIAGGDLNSARKLLNHPDVSQVLSPQQFRAGQQRIELVEAKRIEQEVADNVLFQQEADRLGIRVEQLTPAQKAGLKSSKRSPAFLAQEMFALAVLEHGTDNPTTDQIQQTTRRNRAAVDPLQKIKDTLQVADGKRLNLLRFENRIKAEGDLQALNLGQAALESGAKPGSLVELRTGIAKMLNLFGVSDEAIASLNLGSAPMNELLGKSLADLALTQADKISRVTNMSIKLVREVWGTAGNTKDGLAIIFEMAENIAQRDLAIADLAEAEAQRIKNDEPTKEDLKPFNAQLQLLKSEFEIFPEELAEKFKALAAKATAKDKKTQKGTQKGKRTPAQTPVLSKEDAKLQVPEGSTLLGFIDNGETAVVINPQGVRRGVPRALIEKFNADLKSKEDETKQVEIEEKAKVLEKELKEKAKTASPEDKGFFDRALDLFKDTFGVGDKKEPVKKKSKK